MNKIKKAPTTTVAVLAPKQYITALDQVLEIGVLGCLESPINVFKVNWTRLFFVFANFFVLWFFTVWLCDIWCTLLWKKNHQICKNCFEFYVPDPSLQHKIFFAHFWLCRDAWCISTPIPNVFCANVVMLHQGFFMRKITQGGLMCLCNNIDFTFL